MEATVRYLLRWTTRATPFGLFAGAAPVTFGPRAAVRFGERHHAAVRPDDRYIAAHATAAERSLSTLRRVAVMTNALGYARDQVWVLPCARLQDDRTWDVEIDLTGPVRGALTTAASPIAFGALAQRITERAGDTAAAERLLAKLVEVGALLSEVRPPMTTTDPAAHLTAHHVLPDPGDNIAIDLRIDCSVTLPPTVVREAQDATEVLTAVAPQSPGWADYHRAFLERWGPGAAVPLREVVAVLGFPAGYRGSHRRIVSPFTARDALLVELAQRSVLDREADDIAEVVLNEELVDALRGDDARPPVPHTELRFTLAAATPADLDRGAFTLTVVSGARHAGVAAARFLHLLTPPERERFARVYWNLPTALPSADVVQLSGPPLDVRMATVARVPELLPVLPVGDFHPAPRSTLADLAVTGDGRRLWLVSRTTGRPVEPLLFNCVRLPTLQQPLIRFLTEIWTAWTAPCMPFDWGHARALPFLPRVRRGRTVLHPAQWRIRATDLPGRAATWAQWHCAWQQYRGRRRIPREILFGADDIQLRLDVEERAHLSLLRSHLNRHPDTVLTEAPGNAGWIDGRAAELLLTLTHTPPPAPQSPIRPSRPVSTVQHRPGQSRWLDARVHGQIEDLLARLTDHNLPADWWFLRYPDPEPHLRLRFPLPDTSQFADLAHDLARLAEQWHEDGLLADYTLATYRPETRYGSGPTLTAAETVFAADSRAVLQLLSDQRQSGGDRQVATAAGMITIAHGFTDDSARWLVDHVPHRSGPRLDPAHLAHARDPYGDDNLTKALSTYRALIDQDGLDPDQMLADLLHLHHARMIGPDTASERHCLRLARAVARTDLARRTP